MKSARSGGRVARRFGVRFLVAALACAVALAGASSWQGRARAQVKAPGAGTKSSVPLAKTGTKAARVAGVKKSPAKTAQAPVGELTPQALGCSDTPINVNQTISGSLQAGDCTLSDGRFFDSYAFSGTAGQQVFVNLASSQFDTFLYLLKPGETTISSTTIQDDDGGTGGINNSDTNSRIPTGTGSFTLPTTGTYSIIATSFAQGGTGSYIVTLSNGAPCSPRAAPRWLPALSG